MSLTEDQFQPKLGRIRHGGGAQTKRYLTRILEAVRRQGAGSFAGGPNGSFSGTRIGRGAGIGHASAFRRHPFERFRGRRVVVKVRLHTLKGDGLAAAQAHMRYIERDGVGRDGAPEQLYSREGGDVDSKAFIERGENDRHQFRLIVSPEDSDEIASLTNYTRDFMRQVEQDLGSRLDWVAVNHYNTDNPHTHIVIRGKDEKGKDLIIARDYLTYGLRRRACELATDELGPRRDFDIARMQQRQVDQERFTELDRELIENANEGLVNINTPTTPYDRFRRSLLIGRLTVLERMELATNEGPGEWRLDEKLEPILRNLGRRHDTVRTMQAALGPDKSAADFDVFDGSDPSQKSVLGRVAAKGLSDELKNDHYVIIDADDGRQHYVEVGKGGAGGMPPVGSVVEVIPTDPKPRSVDLTIDAIAKGNGGTYSDDLHLAHDPTASAAFREAHKRRLEALRRRSIVDRLSDGTWDIPQDFVARAQEFDMRQKGRIRIQTLSWLSIDKLVEREAATWLDAALKDGWEPKASMRGFVADLETTLNERRSWLMDKGFAEDRNGRLEFRPGSLDALRQKELAVEGARLAKKLGQEYVPAIDGMHIEGTYRTSVRLASGRFAVIEQSKEFTLVPWRDVLEKHRNKTVSGLMRGADISWTFGRKRGLGL